jgi:Zinc finger, C2H2 type/Zinc-finger of C2H2 type
MKIEKYKCELCDKYFDRKYDLKRHSHSCQQINSIDQIDMIDNYKSGIKCDICQKKFYKKFNLDRHLSSNRGDCYKIRNGKHKSITINNNNQIYNQTIIQNQTNITNNILNIQPVIEKVILAKHGEETISHITKEVMLEILNIESFPKMCTELMRLLYFNKEVPENQNWTIVYPKNKNAGIEFNETTSKFERKSTYDIIDDKFSNMVSLLFDLVQEISRDDIENDNLSKRQKINVNKYCMHYGQLNISKTSKDVYQSIHSLAYDSRKTQMEVWKDNGHSGNHLSLKF